MTEPPDSDSLAPWRLHLGRDDVDPVALRRSLSAGGNLVAAIELRSAGAEARISVGAETSTHRDLCRRAARVAAALAGLGVGRDSRVLLAGETSLGFVAAYLATLRLGATAVLAEAAMTEFELAHLIDEAEPRLAIVGPRSLQALARADRGEVSALKLSELPEETDPGEAPDPRPGPAILAYTSGTTGRPKAVPLSHANLLASIRGAMAAWRWSAGDHLVHALPLSHQHGLSGVHISMLAGSSLEIHPRFEPDAVLASLTAPEATAFFAVPSMYERLDALEPDPVSLRIATSGSAPLPSDLALRARRWLGQLPLERYGSTEAGLVLSNPLLGERLPGCVGFPLPGIEVRIAPLGDASAAGPGEGELLVRGPQVFSGYLGLPPGTGFAGGGWFKTGDLARVEGPRGDIRIVGRLKEMIVSGGLNVYPREVEGVLLEHPQVAEAVVVGVPSPRWGERVVAIVRSEGELDAAELDRFCRSRLSPHKRPKEFVATAELPKTDVGKVRREAALAIARQAVESGNVDRE